MSILSWGDLKHQATRTRLNPTPLVTKDGTEIDDWETFPPQSTHVLYCRPTNKKQKAYDADSEPAPVDIKDADRLTDAATGLKYRVEFVSDEGGQGDHFKVYLCVDKAVSAFNGAPNGD